MFMDDEVYHKNTLYVSTNGQGSHTFSYVSVGDFVPNSDVTVLLPKREMTLKEKLFMQCVLRITVLSFLMDESQKDRN